MNIDYFKNRKELKYSVFFEIANSLSKLSKDTRGVGAVIVSRQGNIIGTGYNGAPFGFDDDNIPKTKEKVCTEFFCGVQQVKILDENISLGLEGFENLHFKLESCQSKYEWTRHAEVNAIRSALRSDNAHLLKDSILFCTRFPCEHCALSIAEESISEVHVPYDLTSEIVDGKTNLYCIGEGSKNGLSTLRINEAVAILKHKSIKLHFNNIILG